MQWGYVFSKTKWEHYRKSIVCSIHTRERYYADIMGINNGDITGRSIWLVAYPEFAGFNWENDGN